MDIITAVVMGGVSTTGGEGRIANVVVGLVFMGVLVNGMMMLNIPNYYQRVVKGIVLLLAISYDKLSQKRAARVL
jgi:ribose/xylose/arabinose/galactoside ABC-type transport system permease subunit